MTRSPLAAFLLALLDGAIAGAILWAALAHGGNRDVLAHFAVYAGIVFAFKARDAARRLPALVAQARASTSNSLLLAGRWLRITRLLLGYDSWSRTERVGIIAISLIVCSLFGWARGGPFAAALFAAISVVNGVLALVAWGARLTVRSEPGK